MTDSAHTESTQEYFENGFGLTIDSLIVQHINTVGVLGISQTLPYIRRVLERYGFKTILPGWTKRGRIDKIILDELVHKEIKDPSRKKYRQVIEELAKKGAQGVILGCTEISSLIQQEHSPIPVFNTTAIHAQAILDYAMKK